MPDGDMPDMVKQSVRKYAEYLNTLTDEEDKKIAPPETDEQFFAVHPITRFRAVCWEVYGNAMMADGLLNALKDCGLGVFARAAAEEKPLIITP